MVGQKGFHLKKFAPRHTPCGAVKPDLPEHDMCFEEHYRGYSSSSAHRTNTGWIHFNRSSMVGDRPQRKRGGSELLGLGFAES